MTYHLLAWNNGSSSNAIILTRKTKDSQGVPQRQYLVARSYRDEIKGPTIADIRVTKFRDGYLVANNGSPLRVIADSGFAYKYAQDLAFKAKERWDNRGAKRRVRHMRQILRKRRPDLLAKIERSFQTS